MVPIFLFHQYWLMIKIKGTAAVGGKRKLLNFALRHATVFTFLSTEFWTKWYHFWNKYTSPLKTFINVLLARVAKDPDAELYIWSSRLFLSRAGTFSTHPTPLSYLHINWQAFPHPHHPCSCAMGAIRNWGMWRRKRRVPPCGHMSS